ncbi:ribonucleoside-diphosphate reductase large subunit [Striga asiatica]|uniref:Ribonucleoside-diphosphate reductase large subunit n=1 Tax=Striga asiatica TaxID=4170 RepID=A0A5A7RAX2_STRAF|nr:ribonucleoside-diphosphate reductase large subunit [Striga asiatica]
MSYVISIASSNILSIARLQIKIEEELPLGTKPFPLISRQIHITHVQFIEFPQERVEEQRISNERLNRFLRPQQNLIMGEARGAGAGDDFLDQGLGSAVTLAGNRDLDHCEVGGVVVLVMALLGGPPEDVEGEVRVGLGPQGVLDVLSSEARL